MPLLHRKPFIRQNPPADLRPDEEVFLCKITYEIFRTYDEFFERTILCNSLVWSCALTGRAGLTYLEAMESERRARQSLKSFPPSLLVPLLHLAAMSRCSRLSDLCEDVFMFIKNRFFPGEAVELAGRNGDRQVCEILQVHSPYSTANGAPAANANTRPADTDSIVISDSDDESHAVQSPPPTTKGKKPLSPSVFKYTVRMDAHSEPFTINASRISHRKATVSRERLKLLFKQHCEPVNGTIAVKVSTVTKYQLCEQTFSQFFPDDSPLVSFSSGAKGGGWSSPGQGDSSVLKEKLKLLQQKEEIAAARLKMEKEAQEAKRREKEEQRRMCEEEKQRRREEKELRKLEKEKEREKLKEEKKKYAERLKLWNKPREDMECEDLKELPCPLPVRTRLPSDLFGEALMVLEFLQAFGQYFDLKDEFPDGVSLEVLEEALVSSDPEGPLCELLFFFLSAIFQALDEELEEGAKEQAEDLSEVLDDDGDAACSALSAVASLAAVWPQLFQGCSLKQLDLDSCTLTEILRLHILASGADCHHGNAKFRYQKQGGFMLMDDPCVELRLAEAGLLKRLSTTAVYDLTPGEKLKILQALVGKLLTLASTRDLIEDCVEEQRSARQDLREIRAEQHRRQREEAALRVRLRKEEKLKEQEKLRETEGDLASRDMHGGLHAEENQEQAKVLKSKEQQMTSELRPSYSSLTAEEQEKEQEKIQELQERIQKAAACTCLLPLGRDRLYRRYWLLPSASTLFVEDDCFGLTEEMLQPQQYCELDTKTSMEEEEVKEEPAEGSAGSVPAPLYSSGLSVQRHNQWSFYSSMEEVDHLIEALNPRGHREGSLKEALLQERDRLQLLIQNCNQNKYSHTDHPESSRSVPECTSTAETVMEARLRDLLLDIEDRIYQGTLGSLKVKDRQVWRSALESGNYEPLCSTSRESGGFGRQTEHMDVDTPFLARAGDRRQLRCEEVTPCSGSTTPQVISRSVHHLAEALSHIEQGIERRFLKPPLGEEDSKKEQKMKKTKKKDEDRLSEDGSEGGRVCKTVLERWRESLQSCTSLSQVFVHLSSLERSVLWSRSILNARCRICRRKGDADNMLLCDGCDRGHHTHCLRPRLKAVPQGDWFCPDCRPKQRSSRLTSRQQHPVHEEEDEEGVEEQEEMESAEEDEPEDASDEEVVVSTRKKQALPLKGRSRTAAKIQTPVAPKTATTSRKSPASRSVGKKATAHSGNQVAEVQQANGSRASAQTESRKRAVAGAAVPPKPSKPVTPSASCSRRSSGRSHGIHELSTCEQLIVELVRHQDSWPFMKLVSKTQVPDYYDIIKKPIALNTIREKVNNCEYQSAGEFIADVTLMFSNCFQYNPRHTTEAKAGLRLQLFFHSELRKFGLSEHDSASPAKRSRH
eukprot:XP_011618139.1 PREDICTED: bromodomain adjacent to zinc finger domain protein 1A [Takifugu rubripes]